VEIPLLAYLLSPKATVRWVTSLHNWIRSRRRVNVSILLAAVGCVFPTVGVAGL
jgi:Sap, sulfolipid-1-addressing protein